MYVKQERDDYFQSGRFKHGFLRFRCEDCHHEPRRQWVLSFPFRLGFLLANYPEFMGKVIDIVQRVLSTHVIRKTGFTRVSRCPPGVSLDTHRRDRLERSCRCVSRPVVSDKLLALASNRNASFGGLPPEGVTIFHPEES